MKKRRKKIEKYSFYPQDPKNNVIDIKTVFDILDQPKPALKKEVVEWLEGLKKEFPDNLPNQLYHVTRHGWGNGLEYKDSKTKKMKTLYNCGGKIKKDLVNALIYGYTVEKEKLYTVEIPSIYHGSLGYSEIFDNVSFYNKEDATEVRFELTEQEIQQTDERLLQFAKEVTE